MSRLTATFHSGGRSRGGARVLAMLIAVLACGAQVSCDSAASSRGGAAGATSASGTCGQASTTDQSQTPRTSPSGAAGSATASRHSAPPPRPTSSPPPPTPVSGRVALTAANSGQTIVVSPGTVIEVDLEPVSTAVWTLPESSDPQALPRLSASGACQTAKVATFRAVSSGEISATRPNGDAEARVVITIRVT